MKENNYKEDYKENLKFIIRIISYLLSFVFGFKIITNFNIFEDLTYKYCDFIFKFPNNSEKIIMCTYLIIYILLISTIYKFVRKKNLKFDTFLINNLLLLILGVLAFYCVGIVLFFRCDTGP